MPLAIAVPLLAAVVLRSLPPSVDRRVRDGLAVLSAAATALVTAWLLRASAAETLVHWVAGWTPREENAIGIALVADPIGAGIAALGAVLMTAVLLTKWNRETVDDRSHTLALIFLGGFCGFAFAGDLLTLFVFLETTSIAAYAITGYRPQELASLQGAVNFALTNTIGATLFLTGAAVLYAHAGTPNLAEIAELLNGAGVEAPTVIALGLMTAGLFTKAAVVPFHFWHADSHAVAPSWAAAFFSAVLIQVALYAIARLHWTAFAGPVEAHTDELRAFYAVFAVLTAGVAAVMCLVQDDLKRMLAFSTVAHLGIAAIGFATFEPDGIAGAGTYVVGHGLVKAGLFLAAGWLLVQHGTVSLAAFSGRAYRLPLLGGILAVGGLGLAGLPPFGMYTGKVLIDEAAEAVGYGWLSYVALAAAALTGAAVLRAAALVGLRATDRGGDRGDPDRDGGQGGQRVTLLILVPAVALMAASAVIGPLPTFIAAAEEAGERFVEVDAYVDAVLHGEAVAEPRPEPEDIFTAESLVESALAALAALILVAASLAIRPTAAALAPLGAAVGGLRRVHSGHVGDYVTWLVAGTAAIGITLSTLLR